MPPATPVGRLVIVLERDLHPASRTSLHALLCTLSKLPEPTFVASLARPAFVGAVKADTDGLFYNATDIGMGLPETLGLMPWREVWLVNRGKVWCSRRCRPLQHAA